ncbi:MAG: hypothetical protein H7177_10355 [Rhizobacter sp.]|nr:hypothetical protein [Bacteriovorax sp.]
MKLISIKKGLLSLTLCLLVAASVTSCAQSPSRNIAEYQKNDVAKVSDGEQAPHKFHSKRFEQYNSLY